MLKTNTRRFGLVGGHAPTVGGLVPWARPATIFITGGPMLVPAQRAILERVIADGEGTLAQLDASERSMEATLAAMHALVRTKKLHGDVLRAAHAHIDTVRLQSRMSIKQARFDMAAPLTNARAMLAALDEKE